MWDEPRARALADKCVGKPGTVTEESKPTTQSPPLLYDLTSLQREANGRFGFPARMTLSLAQALYEKHKVLTYPRTDARALPEDYIATVKSTLEELGETNAFGGFAREILKQKWVKPNKRIFDNSKISDHFAIIPTLVRPKHLNEAEAKLYDFVVRRFLAVFYPAAEHLVTTRITRVEGEPFKTEGKVLVSPGWLAVYGKEAQGEEASLAPVKPNEKVATEKVDVNALVTRPPPRYNEGTLLSAMEGAGKAIEDDELREAMREKGLGTPATRASIIEGLISERYIHREGKELTPTAKAFSLMTLLHGLGIPELFSPELTAEWEFKLAQMEHGKLARPVFMDEIVKMTEHIVGQAKNYESDTIPGDFATLTQACPKCGGEVHEKYKKFQCMSPACDFAFWKIMGGRQIEPQEADTLIEERSVGPLEGFRSKMGRPFCGQAEAQRRQRGRVRLRQSRGGRGRRGARLLRQDAARALPEMPIQRLRARQLVRVREERGSRQDLRLPLGPHDPATAGRARADAQAPEGPQDRSPAIRLGAYAPAVLGVPRGAARRQGRLRVRGEGPREVARPAPVDGAARAGRASEGQAARRAARGALRSLREARRHQRHAARSRPGRCADARRRRAAARRQGRARRRPATSRRPSGLGGRAAPPRRRRRRRRPPPKRAPAAKPATRKSTAKRKPAVKRKS